MWTVKELIETLQQCPEDYRVTVITPETMSWIESVGIDNAHKTVDIFTPY